MFSENCRLKKTFEQLKSDIYDRNNIDIDVIDDLIKYVESNNKHLNVDMHSLMSFRESLEDNEIVYVSEIDGINYTIDNVLYLLNIEIMTFILGQIAIGVVGISCLFKVLQSVLA